MSPAATEFAGALNAHTLRSCQLFADISPRDLDAVAALAVRKSLEKGQLLFRQSEPAEGFYVVQRGRISLQKVSPSGKSRTLYSFRAGESFAETALATESYTADAHALEDSTVLLIPKARFVDFLQTRPELTMRILSSLSQRLRVLMALVDDLTMKDVESRLLHWLLEQCPRPLRNEPVLVPLSGTKRMLAAELGTTAETLSRTFRKLRGQSHVRVAAKAITVLDPRRLEALLRRNLGDV